MTSTPTAGDVTSRHLRCACQGLFTFRGRWQELAIAYKDAPSFPTLERELSQDYREVLVRIARLFKQDAQQDPVFDPAGPCRSLIGKPGAYRCTAEVFGHCRQAGTVRQGRVGPACFGKDKTNLQRPRLHGSLREEVRAI